MYSSMPTYDSCSYIIVMHLTLIVSQCVVRAPKIIEDLRDVRVMFRDQITLEVVAECQEQMEYKWQMKIQKSMDWQDVSYRGQGTPTLVIPGVEDEDEGLFRCVVSSEGGETVTREASLRIS